MMRKRLYVLMGLSACMMLALTISGAAQSKEIAGTWIGETRVPPNGPVPESPDFINDNLTLTIRTVEGTYDVFLTDSEGYAQEAKCENVAFTQGELSFRFILPTGGYINVTLTAEADSMTGRWRDEEGAGAEIRLRRKELDSK